MSLQNLICYTNIYYLWKYRDVYNIMIVPLQKPRSFDCVFLSQLFECPSQVCWHTSDIKTIYTITMHAEGTAHTWRDVTRANYCNLNEKDDDGVDVGERGSSFDVEAELLLEVTTELNTTDETDEEIRDDAHLVVHTQSTTT